MELTKSQFLLNGLDFLDSVDSTNLEMARKNAIKPLENFSAVVAGAQTAGSGRLGRSWVSEPGASISLSIMLRPNVETKDKVWASLIAGVSMVAAAKSLAPDAAISLKWPNDILVDGKKLCGILSQLQPDGSVVLGVGINLLAQNGAPDHAISMTEIGSSADFDETLSRFLTHFRARWNIFENDPLIGIKKTQTELAEVCSTLGTNVRAEIPGGEDVYGVASSIDSSGALVILTPKPVTLLAADVWHLRN